MEKYQNLKQFQNIAEMINTQNLWWENRFLAEFYLLLACQYLIAQGLPEKDNLKTLQGRFPYINQMKIEEVLAAAQILKSMGDDAYNGMQKNRISTGAKVEIPTTVNNKTRKTHGLVTQELKDSLQVLESGTGNVYYCSPLELKKLERIISN